MEFIKFPFYRQQRWGVRQIEGHRWLTYTDGEGHEVPFIVGTRVEANHRIDGMEGGIGCEFFEAAVMSDLDLAETRRAIQRGGACR